MTVIAYIACFVFLERYLQGQGPLFRVVVLGVAVVAAFVAFALSLLLVKVAMKSTRFRRRVEQKAGLTSKDSCRASRDTILGWTKTGPGTAVAMGVSTSVGMS